jgi:hypothetical protein
MPTIAQQYAARLKRVTDATRLVEPDRVPLVPVFQAFPVYYAGTCTVQEAMEDFGKAAQAYDVFYDHFQPDLGWDPILFYPTNYMESSGLVWFKWPGKHIEDPNCMYQFIEDEYMKGDEYGEAIGDITKFMMNKWVPRSFSRLKGLSKIDFRNSMWFGHMGAFAAFSDPEVIASLEALVTSGKQLMDWFIKLGGYDQKMKERWGIPVLYAGFAYAPFDMIGDTLRGTEAILLDMYERPKELLRLIDVVTEFAIRDTIAGCSGKATPFVWYWLHKGVDEFMSDEQFRQFYWPSLLKYVTAVADAGLTPVLYVEGKYNTRLDYLRDVPRGKCIFSFEHTDMAKAKKALGGHSCIMGNVPAALLAYGERQEVVDCCKSLIDTCAPGGGFIMDSGTMIDDAKVENVEAMFETTFTYGQR